MIFGLFKKKPDNGQVAIRLAGTALGMQLALGSAGTTSVGDDRFALGYIFGFHDGLLQVLSVPGGRSLPIISVSFDGIFGDPVSAGIMLKKCLALSETKDAEYLKGRMSGGDDALAYVREETPPMSLALHLQTKLTKRA